MNIQSLAAALALGVAMGLAAPSTSFAAEFEAARHKRNCEEEKRTCLRGSPTRDEKRMCEAAFRQCKLGKRCDKHPRDKKCRPVSP